VPPLELPLEPPLELPLEPVPEPTPEMGPTLDPLSEVLEVFRLFVAAKKSASELVVAALVNSADVADELVNTADAAADAIVVLVVINGVTGTAGSGDTASVVVEVGGVTGGGVGVGVITGVIASMRPIGLSKEAENKSTGGRRASRPSRTRRTGRRPGEEVRRRRFDLDLTQAWSFFHRGIGETSGWKNESIQGAGGRRIPRSHWARPRRDIQGRQSYVFAESNTNEPIGRFARAL
jgi:hypothetical protein